MINWRAQGGPGTSFHRHTYHRNWGSTEVLPTGQKVTVCPSYLHVPNLTSPFADYQAQDGSCWSRQDLTANTAPVQLPPGHVGGYVDVVFPMLVAAIDPVAEQQLVGLGNAVTSGRYLRPADSALAIGRNRRLGRSRRVASPCAGYHEPVRRRHRSNHRHRFPASAVDLLHQGLLPDKLAAALAKERATPVEKVTITAQQAIPAGSSRTVQRRLYALTAGATVPTAVRWH